MAEGPEVRTKLVLDDKASAALDRVKKGFEGVHHSVVDVAKELVHFARDAAAVAVGFQLGSAIESVKNLGEEILGAATNLDAQRLALAGVLAMTDDAHTSFEDLQKQAASLHEEFSTMGVRMGASTAAINDAFAQLAARSTRGTEEVKKLTEQMVTAAQITPGGLQAITTGFSLLEVGVVRANNPVIQMIRQMGLMKGSAREIAGTMSKMATEPGGLVKVMQVADEAVRRMSERAKKAPLSFAGLITSLKTIRENIFETLGVPILQALRPPLEKLQTYFIKHREEIEKWAKSVGTKVGVWVTEAATKIKEGFQWIETHAEEIKNAFLEGAEAVKTVVEFILAHKEALAIAFGAHLAGKGIAGVIGLGGKVAGAVGEAGGAVPALAGVIGRLNPVALAATAAVGGLYLALDQWQGMRTDLKEGTQRDMRNAMNDIRRFVDAQKGWTDETQTQFDDLKHQAMDLAAAAGYSAASVKDLANKLKDQHEVAERISGAAAAAAGRAERAEGVGTELQLSKDTVAGMQQDAMQAYIGAMNDAVNMQNDAAIANAGSVLAKSGALKAAFLDGAGFMDEGFAKMIERLRIISPAVAKALEGMLPVKPGEKTGTGEVPKGFNVNVGGGNTFNIKQDFRDQDPDRVALVFQRDVARAAISRVASGFTSPFGAI